MIQDNKLFPCVLFRILLFALYLLTYYCLHILFHSVHSEMIFFLQTEIKEEIKDEPIGPDDYAGREDDTNSSWGGEGDSTPQERSNTGGHQAYRKVPPSLYAVQQHSQPPPGLHPTVSGTSGLPPPTSTTTTTSALHVLPMGLFRVGSYAVVS